jgi:hypothetical protein
MLKLWKVLIDVDRYLIPYGNNPKGSTYNLNLGLKFSESSFR